MLPYCGCDGCVTSRLNQNSDTDQQVADFRLTGERWPVSPQNASQGSTVTWSIATANYAADYIQFDGFISNAQFASVIRAAFEAWEKVTNIDFVEVADSSNVDVRLGWGDLGGPGGTIGSANWSFSGNTITQSFIRFDRAENWTYNIGPASSGVGAYQAALHEIGHIMGIAHSSVNPSIMYPTIFNSLPGLTQDDINAARAIYGPPPAVTPPDPPSDPDPAPPSDPDPTPPGDPAPPPNPGGIYGTSGGDTLSGTRANDRIYALSGNDAINFSGGSDSIDGGSGNDKVVYRLARTDLSVDKRGDSQVVVRKPDGGTDTLVNVERVDLTDGDYVFDIGGPNLGFGYRIYQAAFGRTPDEGGLRFWVGELDNFDQNGWSEGAKHQYLASAFYNSDEFRLNFGSNISDSAYIEAMYSNVLSRTSDAQGRDYWVGRLQSDASREDILISFAQSDENVQRSVGNYEDGVWVA